MDKVIWLPHGIYNDETNEHVDNMACFLDEKTVLLATSNDKSEPLKVVNNLVANENPKNNSLDTFYAVFSYSHFNFELSIFRSALPLG